MLALYHNAMSTCSQKVRFVLIEKDMAFDSHSLNLRAGDQHKPEFLRLNPKGLVPVLVHDDAVLCESNIINEYLDEISPERPLMPDSAVGRAEVRAWAQRLDTELHMHIAALSFGIAFREQLLAVHDTPEKLEAFLQGITVPAMQAFYRDMLGEGMESPRFAAAVQAWDKALGDMEAALAERDWLVAGQMTLADIAYSPYLTRLEHLGLAGLWAQRPQLGDWFERIKATAGYEHGIREHFNEQALEQMARAGESAWPRVQAILEEGV